MFTINFMYMLEYIDKYKFVVHYYFINYFTSFNNVIQHQCCILILNTTSHSIFYSIYCNLRLHIYLYIYIYIYILINIYIYCCKLQIKLVIMCENINI